MGRGAGYCVPKLWWSSRKICVPGNPEVGVWPEEKHFVSGNFSGFSLYISSEVRWVGRVAHLVGGVAQGAA
jgi:hypothetical protein